MVFLSPTEKADHPFWKNYIHFMEAAGQSLGVDLKVVTATDRYAMVDAVRRIVSGSDKPDYLVTVFLKGAGPRVLELADEHGVPVFLVNTVIQPEDMNEVGYPRKRFPCWLGDMCYSDRPGGRALAEALLAAARSNHGRVDRLIGLVALTGTLDNAASTERVKGLEQALEGARDILLHRRLNCYWKREVAYAKTARMLRLSPGVRIVWAASDAMALGAAQAVEETGREVGSDVFFGGFDWTVEGLEAIEQGRLLASAGGHFMEGAWALVLLHDHFRGKDFAPLGVEFRLPMQLMDAGNVQVGRRLLDPESWKRIDFRRFSRVYSGRDDYDFGVDRVLESVPGQTCPVTGPGRTPGSR